MITKNYLAILTLSVATWSIQADEKWDISKLDLSKLPPASDKTGVTYAKDIRPLFVASCLRCHGGQQQKGSLRLDRLESVLKGGEDGKVVVSGDSKHSLLVVAAAQLNNEIAMPPKHGHAPHGSGDRPGFGAGEPRPGAGGPGAGPGSGGPNHPGGFGTPPKPLTTEQVGLMRAWIDQGAN